jgi:hypothetical protein
MFLLSSVKMRTGILRWWTEKILSSFSKHGLSYELIDLRDPDWYPQFTARLTAARPEFCFSFQRMGTNIQVNDGSNFWERTGIPFLSYLETVRITLPNSMRPRGGACICYMVVLIFSSCISAS